MILKKRLHKLCYIEVFWKPTGPVLMHWLIFAFAVNIMEEKAIFLLNQNPKVLNLQSNRDLYLKKIAKFLHHFFTTNKQ